MQRNAARLAELGFAYGEYGLREIDVIAIKSHNLADAHARDDQQAEQRGVGPRTQARLRRSCRAAWRRRAISSSV
jgi:hypothetical protein